METTFQCAGAVTVMSNGRLQVGLVEAGEHPLGVGGLELRVEVDRVVDRVDEAVQALAGVHVPAVGVDDELVALGEAGQRDAGGLVVAGDVELDAVERGAAARVSAAMSMKVSAPASASNSTVVTDRNVLSPGAPAPSVRSRSIAVAVDGDERGAFDGLVAGQVRKCHASNLVAPLAAGRARRVALSGCAEQSCQSGQP